MKKIILTLAIFSLAIVTNAQVLYWEETAPDISSGTTLPHIAEGDATNISTNYDDWVYNAGNISKQQIANVNQTNLVLSGYPNNKAQWIWRFAP